eukprot:Gb_21156 [translate_table: standard]
MRFAPSFTFRTPSRKSGSKEEGGVGQSEMQTRKWRGRWWERGREKRPAGMDVLAERGAPAGEPPTARGNNLPRALFLLATTHLVPLPANGLIILGIRKDVMVFYFLAHWQNFCFAFTSASCSSSTILNSSHNSISESSSSFSCVSLCSFDRNGMSSARSSISCDRPPISLSWNANKPHKANDAAWEAIRALRCQDGLIGLNHFKLLRRIGSGDIGKVYMCQLKGLQHCVYAMKVVDKDALAHRNKLHRAEVEKQILATLDHPFLPTLYAHFDASHYSCLVMEFCSGGDLHSLRQRQHSKRFYLPSARFYAAEVLLALEYLHMMGVIYRDLKPENVLVREDGHIMLSDFDLSFRCDVVPTLQKSFKPSTKTESRKSSFSSTSSSLCAPPPPPSACKTEHVMSCTGIVPRNCFFPSTKKKNKRLSSQNPQTPPQPRIESQPELVAEPTEARSRSFVGTHEYLAPEVISGKGHGSAVDWWTFGIFLYEMLYGRTPFKGINKEITLMNIITQPLKFPERPDRDLEAWDSARDLIKRLLMKDPRRRLGSTRGAADVKRHLFFREVNWALIRSTMPPESNRDRLRRTKSSNDKVKKSIEVEAVPPHFDYF